VLAKQPEMSGLITRQFLPYKRTKDWWEREYRTRFRFPMEQGPLGITLLDDHHAWEHYNLRVLLSDSTTRAYLGFMCPMCGVWASSVTVQTMKARCEFCNVKSRLQEDGGGESGG